MFSFQVQTSFLAQMKSGRNLNADQVSPRGEKRHALIRACLSPNFIRHTVLSMTIVPQVDLHCKSKTLPIYCRFTARLLPSSSGGSNSSRNYGLSRGYSRIGSCSTCGQPPPASIMGRRLMSMMYRRSCTMLFYAVIFCCAFT